MSRGLTRREVLRSTITSVSALALASACAPAPTAPPLVSPPLAVAATPTPTGTLYQRLGGGAAIQAVTDDLLAYATSDARIASFFTNADVGRLRQLLIEQLTDATGGPARYSGRDMRTVHAGKNITEAHWNAFIQDLVKALDKNGAGGRERDDLLELLATMHQDVVDVPGPA